MQISLDKYHDICHDIYIMAILKCHDNYDIYGAWVKICKETKGFNGVIYNLFVFRLNGLI